MAYEDNNENDGVDYEGGTPEARKGSMEHLSLADVESQSLDIDPATDDEDDGDLNYYNDDVSD